MTEEIEGWAVEEKSEHSILLSSPEGKIEANRTLDDSTKQTWYIDADLETKGQLSWKVRVENPDELLRQNLPEIINKRILRHE